MTRQYEGSATAKHIITPLMRLQGADMTRVIIVTLPEATARPRRTFVLPCLLEPPVGVQALARLCEAVKG